MRLLPIALMLTLLVAAPASAATRSVRVDDDFFKPRTLTVTKGTTVKWNFRGDNQHNVQVKRGPRRFHSALKRSGSFKRTMRVRGTYRIVCSIHQPDMRMKLIVQ
jgi:plastocyanin